MSGKIQRLPHDEAGGDLNIAMTAGKKTQSKSKTRSTNRRRASLVVLALIVIFVAGAFWMFVSGHSTTLPSDGKVPDGYLPVSEYSLVQPSSGKPIASTHTLKYSQYTSLSNNNSGGASCSINMKECDHALDTSRGIHPGSSWDDFVRAYGDRIAYEIKVDSNSDGDYYQSYMSDEDRRAEEAVREHRWVTVASFDRDYVQTGKVDLSDNMLTVTFRAGYQSGKMLYTADDQW